MDLDNREGKSSCLRENEVVSEESDCADEMVVKATYDEDLNNNVAEVLLERKSSGNESEGEGLRVRVRVRVRVRRET